MNYGAGIITTRLAGYLFNRAAGINVQLIPYKGSAEVVQALLTGAVDYIIDGVASSLPLIKSGQFRALAKLNSRPLPTLPDVPPLAAAAGMPELDDMSSWIALVAPAGTPRAIVDRLQSKVARSTRTARPTTSWSPPASIRCRRRRRNSTPSSARKRCAGRRHSRKAGSSSTSDPISNFASLRGILLAKFEIKGALARIMHHAGRFLHVWRAGATGDPSSWIGVRQLAVQRVGIDLPLSAARRGTQPRGSWAGRHEAERDGSEQRSSGQLVGSWTRMRAMCSITRAPILIRRSRIVANSHWRAGSSAGSRRARHASARTRRCGGRAAPDWRSRCDTTCDPTPTALCAA